MLKFNLDSTWWLGTPSNERIAIDRRMNVWWLDVISSIWSTTGLFGAFLAAFIVQVLLRCCGLGPSGYRQKHMANLEATILSKEDAELSRLVFLLYGEGPFSEFMLVHTLHVHTLQGPIKQPHAKQDVSLAIEVHLFSDLKVVMSIRTIFTT